MFFIGRWSHKGGGEPAWNLFVLPQKQQRDILLSFHDNHGHRRVEQAWLGGDAAGQVLIMEPRLTAGLVNAAHSQNVIYIKLKTSMGHWKGIKVL